MPEWPEMEHYRRMLERVAAGRKITDVDVQREKSINVPTYTFRQAVVNQKIEAIAREAKMLLFHLGNGQTLLLHLMLGGWMRYGTQADKPDRTIQVTLQLQDRFIYFIGLRLGYLHLYSPAELHARLSELGPDPFDPLLTEAVFRERLSRFRRPLKVLLTDQSVIGGIGNCYSDEICYAARVLPSRKPESLSAGEMSALYNAMHAVLREAVDYGGYMDQPFTADDRITGGYDNRCSVYDREDEPCRRCAAPIRRDEISSKKSFFCASCQR